MHAETITVTSSPQYRPFALGLLLLWSLVGIALSFVFGTDVLNTFLPQSLWVELITLGLSIPLAMGWLFGLAWIGKRQPVVLAWRLEPVALHVQQQTVYWSVLRDIQVSPDGRALFLHRHDGHRIDVRLPEPSVEVARWLSEHLQQQRRHRAPGTPEDLPVELVEGGFNVCTDLPAG